MKTILTIFALLAMTIMASAQCTTYYGVKICNDGGIPSMVVEAVAGGYRVTYDPTGVDFTTPGGNAAQIDDLDNYRCTNCMDYVSAVGYCGSTPGVAMISYTCSMAPWTYNLIPTGTTHNLQLILSMGKDEAGALHFRYQPFKVTDPPSSSAPGQIAPAAPTKKKGNSGK